MNWSKERELWHIISHFGKYILELESDHFYGSIFMDPIDLINFLSHFRFLGAFLAASVTEVRWCV